MNRDIVILPSINNQSIVIATDCTGACGNKPLDIVHVSTETAAYYTARVAFMEVMSVRAQPVAYTVSNFVKDGYEDIHHGVTRLLEALNLSELPNITSSETNFDMVQSALSVTVIGSLSENIDEDYSELSFACVGSPLVGDEVVQTPELMIPIKMFLDLVEDKKAVSLLPVGSKGIAYELKHIYGVKAVRCALDFEKSAGPATCLIIGYLKADEDHFRNALKEYFHPITLAE